MRCLIHSLLVLCAVAFASSTLLGGFQHVDVNTNGVKSASDRAFEILEGNARGFGASLSFNEVVTAELQIIAGTRYRLVIDANINGQSSECHLTVTCYVPTQTTSVTVTPGGENDPCSNYVSEKPTVSVSRKRRSTRLLGGKESIDLADIGVQQAANWAVSHINGMSNSLYLQVLHSISHATRQVVNGYKYKLLLNLAMSSCINNAENKMKTLKECPLTDSYQMQQCDVTIVDVRGVYSMAGSNCKPGKTVLGGDDHDYQPHGQPKHILGGDDHDYVPHGQSKHLLGGDDHDYQPHGQPKHILGGDDHDYVPHGQPRHLLGGDDHDYQPHGQPKHLLGGDDHDYVPHGQPKHLLGGDDHDYVPHENRIHLLGQGIHDYISHGKIGSGLLQKLGVKAKEEVLNVGNGVLRGGRQLVEQMSILGRDSHDFQPHHGDPCLQYKEVFEMFKAKYNRVYGGYQEEAKRFRIFCTNMDKVKEYQKMEQGSAIYGATIFADLSEDEFRQKYMGLNMKAKSSRKWPYADIPNGPVPESWDWRDHGAVTPVKNQGSCGSCWAFSTTGNIEGQNAIKHKKLISLSEQELVDCDKTDEGCNGGLPSQAYEAIIKLGGIERENDYKYEGYSEKCHFNKSEIAIKLAGAVNISKDETKMAAWLFNNGPISIGINAFAMQFYFGGIAHPWKIFCNPKNLDHGVLIVGYGKDGDEPYWIIKNSWGPSWGRKGYYYVYRGDGTCGLNTACTSAVVA